MTRNKRFFLQNLPVTVAAGLALSAIVALLVGSVFETWLAPGFGWEGRSFRTEGTTGIVTLADLDGDGRMERLIAPGPHASVPPSIKINRAQPDQPLPNLQLYLAGKHVLPEHQAAHSADGSLWLAALTASPDTTSIFVSLFRQQPGESGFQSFWQGPLFTPGQHHHDWQNMPQLGAFLFVHTARGERALLSVTAQFLGWRGMVEADLSQPVPALRYFPCGSSQNRGNDLVTQDSLGRQRLFGEGLVARNGNPLGGIDDFWGGLLVYDPDSGFRKGPELGRIHNRFGVDPAPDRRHLLVHTPMLFAPQPGDTFNLALLDSWTGQWLWKTTWPGLLDASWTKDSGSDGELPDFLVLSPDRLSRCRPDSGIQSVDVTPLPADGMHARLEQGHVLIRAPKDELWVLSADGRSRAHIPVSRPVAEYIDPQGTDMDHMMVHVYHDQVLESFTLKPIPFWFRLGRQDATWWALALGVLGLFTFLGFRIHHQEQLLRGIVDDNAQAVALLDAHGSVLYANREFDHLWAHPSVHARLETLLKRPAADEGQVLELGGRWLRGFRRPLVRGRRTVGSVWIGFDETAQREASEGRKFRSLAGLITHELKSPMTPLRLGLDQVRREVEAIHPGGSPGLERVLLRMRQELDHMHQLVGQFMRLAGERQPESRLDLRETVQQALERAAVYQLPGIRLQLELPAEPVLIIGDGEGVAMALCSLITNALEAMELQGTLEIRLLAARSEDGVPGWKLLIQDSGPGIPDELRERIWEAGFSTKPDGFGYGLFFASKVLRQNGAGLRLERAEGGGTLVLVEWSDASQLPDEVNTRET